MALTMLNRSRLRLGPEFSLLADAERLHTTVQGLLTRVTRLLPKPAPHSLRPQQRSHDYSILSSSSSNRMSDDNDDEDNMTRLSSVMHRLPTSEQDLAPAAGEGSTCTSSSSDAQRASSGSHAHADAEEAGTSTSGDRARTPQRRRDTQDCTMTDEVVELPVATSRAASPAGAATSGALHATFRTGTSVRADPPNAAARPAPSLPTALSRVPTGRAHTIDAAPTTSFLPTPLPWVRAGRTESFDVALSKPAVGRELLRAGTDINALPTERTPSADARLRRMMTFVDAATDRGASPTTSARSTRTPATSQHPLFRAVRNKLAVVLDWVQQQEVAWVRSQLVAALTDVRHLHACLANSEPLPSACAHFLTALSEGRVPRHWQRDRAHGVCHTSKPSTAWASADPTLEAHPALLPSALALWLQGMEQRVAYFEGVHAAAAAPPDRLCSLQMLSRPEAVVAAHERSFAHTTGHAISRVVSHATLACPKDVLNPELCFFVTAPLSVGTLPCSDAVHQCALVM